MNPVPICLPVQRRQHPDFGCLNAVRHYVHGFWHHAGTIQIMEIEETTYVVAFCKYQGFSFRSGTALICNRLVSALLAGRLQWYGNLVIFQLDARGAPSQKTSPSSTLDDAVKR